LNLRPLGYEPHDSRLGRIARSASWLLTSLDEVVTIRHVVERLRRLDASPVVPFTIPFTTTSLRRGKLQRREDENLSTLRHVEALHERRLRVRLAEGVLPGSGAIVPIAHRTSVFELTAAEWANVQDLLLQARNALHDLLARTATCLAGTRAVCYIPICMSFRDSTTSHCLTAEGPTAVSGDQASDVHFLGSGGRI
jgi:hypothetical protein